MNITQNLVPQGRKNRPGRANRLQYITIHNTGNTSRGANAQSHANYIKGSSAANIPVSWHYTVDDREIIQHIPDSEIAWHAGDGGSGTGNNASIAIEICMNSDGDLRKATDLAAKLTAHLCKKHGIKPENVVQHNRWSGKNCPQMLRKGKPYSFASFVNKVREELGGTSATTTTNTPPTTTQPSKPTLRQGSRGESVKQLQRSLNGTGAKLSVDGIFGSRTLEAVRQFQKAQGITVDGIVGKNTWAKLETHRLATSPQQDEILKLMQQKQEITRRLQRELNKRNGVSLAVDGIFGPKTERACVIIKSGMRGEIVRILQEALNLYGYNLDVDGIFGPNTGEAVRIFQRDKEIKVDGIAGPQTFNKLLGK